jgi:type IV pilus assembly protein PilM
VQLGNFISRIRGESKTVGLDIGHRLIRVAVVEHKQGSAGTLLAMAHDVLPEGVIVDNEIRSVSVLVDRLQSLLARIMPGGIEGDAVMSVNWTSGILCDKILERPVPKVPEKELLLQAAMRRSPFDDAGNVLDYHVLSRREEGIEAMIVAAKKDGLSPWINIFHALNIRLAAIDVDAFVLGNLYYATNSAGDDSEYDEEPVLLLNIGYSKSYAAFLRDGNFNTARSILGAGVRDLQEMLSSPLGISPEQCGELLMGNDVKDVDIDELRLKSAMEYVFEEIAMKVDTTLRYFSSSDNYRKPTKMIITGGGSRITGLSPFLADRLSIDAVRLEPFKAVKLDRNRIEARFAGIDWDDAACIYPIALGLALRRF